MAKPKKTPRPKAQAPKGFADYFGTDVTERAAMLQQIAAVYHRYGFDALESSAVETVEGLWASSCRMWIAPTKVCLPGKKKTATGWPCVMT